MSFLAQVQCDWMQKVTSEGCEGSESQVKKTECGRRRGGQGCERELEPAQPCHIEL